MAGKSEEVQGIKTVNGPTRNRLSETKLGDYHDYKKQLIVWLTTTDPHARAHCRFSQTHDRQSVQTTLTSSGLPL